MKIRNDLQVWIDARTKHHLSDAQVQMARELGMNSRRFGKIDNHRQENWKIPLPQYIEHLYRKRFGKARPDAIISIEQRARLIAQKKAERRRQRELAK